MNEILATQKTAAIFRHVLADRPWVQVRVTGACMTPDLFPGDTIRLVSAAVKPPRWGDIVLLESPEGLRLHRLVWNVYPLALTKADRSVVFDGTRVRDDILASVVRVDRQDCSAAAGCRNRSRALRSLFGGVVHWAKRRGTHATGYPW